MFIGQNKICLSIKANHSSSISSSDIHLSSIYLQPWKEYKHIFCVFLRKQGFHVTYLCKENKSIKLQAFVWKVHVKLSCLQLRCIISFKKLRAKINVKHYCSKIQELSWQTVINCKLFLDCEWKYTHQTYTLLRICLIKIPSWLARSIQTRSEWQALYRNCVMSTASQLYITICTIQDCLNSVFSFLWEMHTVHHSVIVQSQVTKIFKLASLVLFNFYYFDT